MKDYVLLQEILVNMWVTIALFSIIIIIGGYLIVDISRIQCQRKFWIVKEYGYDITKPFCNVNLFITKREAESYFKKLCSKTLKKNNPKNEQEIDSDILDLYPGYIYRLTEDSLYVYSNHPLDIEHSTIKIEEISFNA